MPREELARVPAVEVGNEPPDFDVRCDLGEPADRRPPTALGATSAASRGVEESCRREVRRLDDVPVDEQSRGRYPARADISCGGRSDGADAHDRDGARRSAAGPPPDPGKSRDRE